MPVKHERELRDIAQRALEVAERINQGPLDQFQTEVRAELRPRGPDELLKDIERKLQGVASAIETYLRQRADYSYGCSFRRATEVAMEQKILE